VAGQPVREQPFGALQAEWHAMERRPALRTAPG
jgi:hypothetical protein